MERGRKEKKLSEGIKRRRRKGGVGKEDEGDTKERPMLSNEESEELKKIRNGKQS